MPLPFIFYTMMTADDAFASPFSKNRSTVPRSVKKSIYHGCEYLLANLKMEIITVCNRVVS